jgi:hypothetical protein
MEGMENEGKKMLAIRKEWADNGELEEKKDLMSLMFKANLQASNKKDKMLDEELMGQITTFVSEFLFHVSRALEANGRSQILAGHETSATTLTWILLHLSRDTAMQQRLRDEIKEANAKAAAEGRSELTAEELTALPFMDALVVGLTIQASHETRLIQYPSRFIERNPKSRAACVSATECSIHNRPLIYILDPAS